MTITEILKAKGISDELIAAIAEEMKSNRIFTASEENLDVRYSKLKNQHDTTSQQLAEANGLIDELKKTNAGNESLQTKVTDYETQIAVLQAKLEETQLDADLSTALLAAGAKPEDLDYVMFKLKAKGKFERGDNGKIKELDDKIAAAKSQLPAHFNSETKINVLENKLQQGTGGDAQPTKEQFKAMSYEQRLKLKNENAEVYKRLAY